MRQALRLFVVASSTLLPKPAAFAISLLNEALLEIKSSILFFSPILIFPRVPALAPLRSLVAPGELTQSFRVLALSGGLAG
jgi:hypothetical protein